MMLAVSDVVWQSGIAAAIAVFGSVIAAAIAALGMWLKFKLDAIQKKADHIERTALKTEKLVNSASLSQHRVVAELARWKADQTNNPAHIEAAIEAERVYREHRKLQEEMDKKNGVEVGLDNHTAI